MEKNYLTPIEAMKYLSVSRNTLKKMVSEGIIPPPARLGSRLMRFDRGEIDKYLSKQGESNAESKDTSGCDHSIQAVE